MSGQVDASDNARLDLEGETSDLASTEVLLTRIRRALGNPEAQPAGFTGAGAFNGQWRGTVNWPVFDGRFTGEGIGYAGVDWGRAEWAGTFDTAAEAVESRPLVLQKRSGEIRWEGCSPTRACLLTGRNPHAVQMRGISNMDSGFPNMRGAIPRSAATLAEVLRANPSVPYDRRIEVARFIEDLTASYQGGWYSVISLHGGGSPGAMKQEIWRNYPLGNKVELVEWLLERGALTANGERAITRNSQPGRCCDQGCSAPGQPVMVPLPEPGRRT